MIPEGLEPKSHKMYINVKQAYKPSKEIILDSQPPPKQSKSKGILTPGELFPRGINLSIHTSVL